MQLRSLLWYYTSFNALYINLSTRCLLVYGIDCNHMGLFAPSAASPLEGAPVTLSDQLTCRNWLAVRLQSGSEWKKKNTLRALLTKCRITVWKGTTWKCWRLTVHVLPSSPEVCEHIQYIWIQTELSDPQDVASCVIATAFSSEPRRVCATPFASQHNKCRIYSPGDALWWASVLQSSEWVISCQDRRMHDLKLSPHGSCFNYKPRCCSNASSPTAG